MGDIGDYWREAKEDSRQAERRRQRRDMKKADVIRRSGSPKPKTDDSYTMGEFYNDVKEAKRERKEGYQKNQMQGDLKWLRSFGFAIEEHNGGGHLTITVKTERGERLVDFWPQTGLWKVRDGRAEGRFVRNFVKYFRLGDGVRPPEFT